VSPFDFLWFRLGALFLLGAIVGSFLNVCIYRLPWRKNIVWPGSHCPRCKHAIGWYDNIPLVSWIVLRGRCRHCGGRISPRYFAVELLTAGLFAFLYWMEVQRNCLFVFGGPPGQGGAAELNVVNHWRYFYHLFLLCAMIVATFIDLDYQIIPDSITVPGMIAGFGLAVLISEVHLVDVFSPFSTPCGTCLQCLRGLSPCLDAPLQGHPWHSWLGNHPHWHSFVVSFAGWFVGGAAVWSVRIVGRLALGREAMGFGDVTLLAMIGSFLGWQAVLAVFVLAPVFGAVLGFVQLVARGENRIPYGPFLCLATLAVLFIWKPLWEFYAVRLRVIEIVLDEYVGVGPLGLLLVPPVLIVLLGVMLAFARLVSALIRGPEDFRDCLDEANRADAALDSFDLYRRRRMLQCLPKQTPPCKRPTTLQNNHRR
jgi:leader peptidase (prepilin peptidase)/N-methyltransferase